MRRVLRKTLQPLTAADLTAGPVSIPREHEQVAPADKTNPHLKEVAKTKIGSLGSQTQLGKKDRAVRAPFIITQVHVRCVH